MEALIAFIGLGSAVAAIVAWRANRPECSVTWSSTVNGATTTTEYEGPASGMRDAHRAHETAFDVELSKWVNR